MTANLVIARTHVAWMYRDVNELITNAAEQVQGSVKRVWSMAAVANPAVTTSVSMLMAMATYAMNRCTTS
jgi:hypothetical protein